MLYVGGTLTAFCCALCVIAVAWAAREKTDVEEPAVREVERVREEDLVRPALDADGRPTWVAADDIVWHEIVDRLPRHDIVPDAGHKRRRTA